MGRFASALEPAVGIGGEAAVVAVRKALFGAAVEQLARLGAVPVHAEAGRFPDRAGALGTLDEQHRIFDAARIRLWLAEERGDPALAAEARATFEALGAHPYLGRAGAVTAAR